MLKVDMTQDGNETVIDLEGMLDVNSADSFREKLNEVPDDAKRVIIDMEKLRYTSSAGLRVILALQNKMDEAGNELIFRNVNSIIMEVFEDTGFVDFMTIE